MADDVPPEVKRQRLNELLAAQEGIGLALNQAWLGREVEVLVERATAPRRTATAPPDDDTLTADDKPTGIPDLAGTEGEGSVALAGRTRHNKLVHLAGDPSLVGRAVAVRIEHAGPFALRGRIVPPAASQARA